MSSLAMAAFSSRSSQVFSLFESFNRRSEGDSDGGASKILCLQDERKKPVISSVNQ